MRVLFVSPYPPARDGIGEHAAAHAAVLSARGHEVAVVSARPSADAPEEVIAALPGRGTDVAAVLATIGAWRPDVVHLQFAVGSYGSRVPSIVRLTHGIRRLPARLVVTMHELGRDTAILRGPGRALYRRIARDADHVVVLTDEAMRRYEDVIGVAPPAAMIPLPDAGVPAAMTSPEALRAGQGLDGKRVLLSFGFIHIDKGLDDLVRALAIVRDSRAGGGELIANTVLVVAGDVRPRAGAFRAFEIVDRVHLAYVRREIARRGLTEVVRFAGFVPSGEVAAWFQLADAAVLPYKRIDQSAVVNLAGATGTSVLLSTAGGLRRASSDDRWSFPPRDPGRMAEVISDFLQDGRPSVDALWTRRSPTLDESAIELEDLYSGLLRNADANVGAAA